MTARSAPSAVPLAAIATSNAIVKRDMGAPNDGFRYGPVYRSLRGAAASGGSDLKTWLKATTLNIVIPGSLVSHAPRNDGALRAQRLLQIRDQVFLVLDADREPNHIGGSPRLDLGGVVELAMRGRGRVDHQRTGVADIGQMREQF